MNNEVPIAVAILTNAALKTFTSEQLKKMEILEIKEQFKYWLEFIEELKGK